MSRRFVRLFVILAATLAIAALAYQQGYNDSESGTWFGFMPAAMAK